MATTQITAPAGADRGVAASAGREPQESLARDINHLGSLLGEVIRDIDGEAIFALEERIRVLAKASRQDGDARATAQLESVISRITPQDAYSMAMAFTTYFELINLCEEHHRIRQLRRRRAQMIAERDNGETPASALPASAPLLRESIEAAVRELKSRGVDPAAMQTLVDQLSIELVFTAHPTESKRRTILSKLRRLGALLWQRDREAQLDDVDDLSDRATIDDAIRHEIVALWLTDRSRNVQPLVTDEVRTGLWYFDSTLWDVLPQLQTDLDQALARHFPAVRAPRGWLKFGSWIGGDRDGNPNVTAYATAETLHFHRRLALDKVRVAARELSRTMTISSARVPVTPAVQALVDVAMAESGHVRELSTRYPAEPYR